MNEATRRRPIRLQADPLDVEPQPWRVRLSNGEERGPVGLSALKSLVDVGLLNAKAGITPVDQVAWQPITEHAVWKEIKPVATEFVYRSRAESVPPMELAVTRSPAEMPVSQQAVSRMEVVRHEEFERTLWSIRFWRLGQLLRALREALVFAGFITVGDLLGSFFTPAMNVAKWACLLCLTVLALGYYSFRAMEK